MVGHFLIKFLWVVNAGNGITQMVMELRLLKFAWPKKSVYKHRVGGWYCLFLCFVVAFHFYFLLENGSKYSYLTTLYLAFSVCRRITEKEEEAFFIFLFWVEDPSSKHKTLLKCWFLHLQGCRISFIAWDIFKNKLKMRV